MTQFQRNHVSLSWNDFSSLNKSSKNDTWAAFERGDLSVRGGLILLLSICLSYLTDINSRTELRPIQPYHVQIPIELECTHQIRPCYKRNVKTDQNACVGRWLGFRSSEASSTPILSRFPCFSSSQYAGQLLFSACVILLNLELFKSLIFVLLKVAHA